MFIITNWSGRFNDLAMALKTIRAVILRLWGVGKELIDRFSKRHRQIDEKTRELLEREPDKANQNIKVIRANIAHKERARKIKDVGIVKLQSIWNKQLSWREQFQLHRLDKHRSPETSQKMTAEQAVELGRAASI